VVAGSVEQVGDDATYTRVTLTLNAPLLDVSAGSAVTVTFDSETETAYISKDANAPTYELTFETAADWVNYDTGIVSVTP